MMEKTLPKPDPVLVMVGMLNGMMLMGELIGHHVLLELSGPEETLKLWPLMGPTAIILVRRPVGVQFQPVDGGQVRIGMGPWIAFEHDLQTNFPILRAQVLYLLETTDKRLRTLYIKTTTGFDIAAAIGPTSVLGRH